MAVRAGRRFTTELKCEAEKRAQQTGRTFCGLEGGCISPRSSERKPRRAPDISNTSTNKETGRRRVFVTRSDWRERPRRSILRDARPAGFEPTTPWFVAKILTYPSR